MAKINADQFITVQGIRYYGRIPIINTIGPIFESLVQVKDIINLLNNGIDVDLAEENERLLYTFVSEYNMYAEKKKLPKVERAEEILYERIYKEAIRIREEDSNTNPFKLSSDEDRALEQEISIERKDNSKKLISPFKNNKKNVRTTKIYDMIATGKRSHTTIEKQDRIMEMIEFGDIEFELE